MHAAHLHPEDHGLVWRAATDAWRFESECVYDGVVDDLDARARLAYVAQLPWWQAVLALLVKYLSILGLPLVAVVLLAVVIGNLANLNHVEAIVTHLPPVWRSSVQLARPADYQVVPRVVFGDEPPPAAGMPAID